MLLKDVYNCLFKSNKKFNIHELIDTPYVRIAFDIEYDPKDIGEEIKSHRQYIQDIIYAVVKSFKHTELKWTILENNRKNKMSWHIVFRGKSNYYFNKFKFKMNCIIYTYINI